jgi:hypothetical protein
MQRVRQMAKKCSQSRCPGRDLIPGLSAYNAIDMGTVKSYHELTFALFTTYDYPLWWQTAAICGGTFRAVEHASNFMANSKCRTAVLTDLALLPVSPLPCCWHTVRVLLQLSSRSNKHDCDVVYLLSSTLTWVCKYMAISVLVAGCVGVQVYIYTHKVHVGLVHKMVRFLS